MNGQYPPLPLDIVAVLGAKLADVMLPLMTGPLIMPDQDVTPAANSGRLVNSGIALPLLPLMWDFAGARCCKVCRQCRTFLPGMTLSGRRPAAERKQFVACFGATRVG
jgi:hypothetical protein